MNSFVRLMMVYKRRLGCIFAAELERKAHMHRDRFSLVGLCVALDSFVACVRWVVVPYRLLFSETSANARCASTSK